MNKIIEINNLNFKFNNSKDYTLKNLNIYIPKNKITCIVGQSGSGKTLMAMLLASIVPKNGVVESGEINFYGQDMFFIFQDAMNSFNPSVKIGKCVYEIVRSHVKINKKDFKEKYVKVLKKLNFNDPDSILNYYPFELSGGMLQRIMIAVSIFINPSLIIADEPTTALDVTVQKEILNIFKKTNRELKNSTIIITHDFGVVSEIADYVIVMKNGNIVETGDVFDIFNNPRNEYTMQLIGTAFYKEGDKSICC